MMILNRLFDASASEMFGRHLIWRNRVEGIYEYRKNT
jgi:hypothetical protein